VKLNLAGDQHRQIVATSNRSFTGASCPALRAGAAEFIDAVEAETSIPTGFAETLVHVLFTMDACEARLAVAHVPSCLEVLVTSSLILTRIRFTLIDVFLTEKTGVTVRADAVEAVDLILTDSAILTRTVMTLIDVDVTEEAGKARWADAGEAIDAIRALTP
jgi:hypothetical protein